MGIIDRLNQIVEYIEENLTKEISTTTLSKIALMSELHFKSMFSVMTNMGLAEYIRKRRLSQAAIDLQNDLTVTEVTYKYGYTSPDAFTRAFRKLHGVNPSTAKGQDVSLKTYPKISFQLTIKGVSEMNFKIVTKEAFEMYGIERIITNVEGENLNEIPQFWQDVMADGSFQKLLDSTNHNRTEAGIYPVNGVMCYGDETMDKFPYAVAAFKTPESNSKGFKNITIGAYQWVVFTTDNYKSNETTSVVQELWRRIYAEWLPSSGYTIIEGPNMELYGNRDETYEYCEVWLPIEKIK